MKRQHDSMCARTAIAVIAAWMCVSAIVGVVTADTIEFLSGAKSEGKMIDGERIVGAKSFEVFASKIDSLLVAQEGRDSGAAPPTGDSEQTK